LAVVHAMHETQALASQLDQLRSDVQQRSAEHFAPVLRALIRGDGGSSGTSEVRRREPEPVEKLPRRFVEPCRIELHVHVADVIDVPRIDKATIGLDWSVHMVYALELVRSRHQCEAV